MHHVAYECNGRSGMSQTLSCKLLICCNPEEGRARPELAGDGGHGRRAVPHRALPGNDRGAQHQRDGGELGLFVANNRISVKCFWSFMEFRSLFKTYLWSFITMSLCKSAIW